MDNPRILFGDYMLMGLYNKSESCNSCNASLFAMTIIVCIYIFLVIERPWESIRYLKGVRIELYYAIIMIIVAFSTGKFRVASSPTNKWIYGLLALHFTLAPFAYNPSAAIDQGVEYLKMIFLYMMILSIADNEVSLKCLVRAYIFSMIFFTFHSLLEFHNGRHEFRMGIERMIGVGESFTDPNAFGASLVLSLPFVHALLKIEEISIIKFIYYTYYACILLCIILTGSRSAFIVFVLLVCLWCFFQQGKNKYIFITILIVTLSAIWFTMPADKQERFRTAWDKDAGSAGDHSSTEGRIKGFLAAWEMFKRSPLTGVGAGGVNFISYRTEQLGDNLPEQAHNLYGQILGGLGIGGIILFIGMVMSIIKCIKIMTRNCKNMGLTNSFTVHLGRSINTSILLLLVFGLSGHNFYRPLWLWIAAWAGSLVIITDYGKKSSLLCQEK